MSLELTDLTELAACKLQGSISPNITSSKHWSYGNMPLSPAFHMNARELNPEHQVCIEDTSLSKPYPQPSNNESLKTVTRQWKSFDINVTLVIWEIIITNLGASLKIYSHISLSEHLFMSGVREFKKMVKSVQGGSYGVALPSINDCRPQLLRCKTTYQKRKKIERWGTCLSCMK